MSPKTIAGLSPQSRQRIWQTSAGFSFFLTSVLGAYTVWEWPPTQAVVLCLLSVLLVCRWRFILWHWPRYTTEIENFGGLLASLAFLRGCSSLFPFDYYYEVAQLFVFNFWGIGLVFGILSLLDDSLDLIFPNAR